MTTRYPIYGFLLTGLLGLALVAPASALSKSGSSLLESLRSKVDTKTEQPPVPETPAKPVVTFQAPSAPETGYEPGVIVPETADRDEPSADPAPRPKMTGPAPKADPAPAQAPDTGSLLGKPPAVRQESTDNAAAPNMQDVLEKLETLRKRLEQGSPKNRTNKTSALKAPPKAPKATETPTPAVLEAPAAPTIAEPAVQEPRQPATGSARQFGELTDAELIQYAHEHVWSSEKSRKHNPPVTPSTKSKKKSKESKTDKAAPAKAGSKKPAAGSAKAVTGSRKAAAVSAKAPSVVVQKAVR